MDEHPGGPSQTPTAARRWVTVSPDAYRRVTQAALVALCLIVVTGAAVRLTGSGLGCSDWPTCEEGRFVASLDFHPMVEWINRLITGLVSLAVAVAVLGSLARVPRRRDLTVWSLALVGGVVAQILIGAVVTLSDLSYGAVAVHFLVSMVLVWAAVVLVERAGRPDDEVREPSPLRTRALALSGWAALLLVSGAVVTSAGPHAGDEAVKRLPLDLEWAARLHGVVVWGFVAAVAWWGYQLARSGDAVLRRRATDLLVAAVAQGAIGYTQYFTDVPPVLVGIHVAGATLVWVMTLRLTLAAASRPLDQGDPVTTAEVRRPAVVS
ncbi:MAG: heme A synthase [Microthrixaceae bacterium]|nr:heme A synthase [Microthrixaceae bacterium]